MSEEERLGRAWCERHGKRPYQPGTYSHWCLGTITKNDWSTLPPVMFVVARLRCYSRSATYIGFETESDAYAAVGAALREMRAVVGNQQGAVNATPIMG